MTITWIITLSLGVFALIFFVLPLLKRKKRFDFNFPEPTSVSPIVTPTPEEVGEMPEKPAPVDCQKASFRAAPEEFFYVDCCGKPNKGEGFQPTEKRTPVSIDVNKPFMGMDLLGEQSDIDC